jgi:uncharacterized membrane protein
VTHAYFRGPLPPPSVVEHFERIRPGAAERILVMAEEQQRVRHQLEERALVGALRAEATGQWLAAFIVTLTVGLGSWLVSSGHDATGLATILAPLGAVVAAFLNAQQAQAREREQKRAELERARMGTPA